MIGMTEGFSINLYLVGVGYRAALEDDPRGTEEGGNGQRLNMKLGFSHSVYQQIPAGIKAEVPTATKISLFGTNKQRLGQFAAEVREWRKPEPYKGKVRSFTSRWLHDLMLLVGDFYWKRADKDKSCQKEVKCEYTSFFAIVASLVLCSGLGLPLPSISPYRSHFHRWSLAQYYDTVENPGVLPPLVDAQTHAETFALHLLPAIS